MSFKVSFDKNKTGIRLKGVAQKHIAILANEALKNCNELCPSDSGTLAKTGIAFSQPEKGLLIWDTPYAKYQWYGVVMAGKPKKPTGKKLHYYPDGTPAHPNATAMWAIKDFQLNRKKYERMLQKLADGGTP